MSKNFKHHYTLVVTDIDSDKELRRMRIDSKDPISIKDILDEPKEGKSRKIGFIAESDSFANDGEETPEETKEESEEDDGYFDAACEKLISHYGRKKTVIKAVSALLDLAAHLAEYRIAPVSVNCIELVYNRMAKVYIALNQLDSVFNCRGFTLSAIRTIIDQELAKIEDGEG